MKHLVAIFAALGLTACATTDGPQLSAAQCATDWGSVGYADGLDKEPEGKIERYRRACAGSSPLTSADIGNWRRGWADAVGVAQNTSEEFETAAAYDDGDDAYEPHHHHNHRYDRAIIRPRIGVGITAGSGGVRTGVGVGFGVGIFNFGLGFGF